MDKNKLIKYTIQYVISNLDDDGLVDDISEIVKTDDIGEIEDILQSLLKEDFD
jgi:hypothetical protein